MAALRRPFSPTVLHILLALTDAFRARSVELAHATDTATDLDVIQARARFSLLVDGVEPVFAIDGAIELRSARHPLLMAKVRARLVEAERSDAA